MKYVIYYRVSSKRQGESGLGLEAQKRDINIFLEGCDNPVVLEEFTDIESGCSDTRKGFVEAVDLAKKQGAELLVSKLDRISRKVSTISLIMEQVKIRVASMGSADNFQLHIYAALAQQEREFISKRTKAALQVAKSKGVLLGSANPKWKESNKDMVKKMGKRRNSVARIHAEKYRKEVEMMVSLGMKLDPMAQKLTELGCVTATGKKYTASGITNLCKYLDIVRT